MAISPDSPRAPYLQVADSLREEIKSGKLGPGQRVPSIKDLAKRFGVSQMTVQNSLRILREQSLIFSAGNRGTFVGQVTDQNSVEQSIREIREEVRQLAERVSRLELGSAH